MKQQMLIFVFMIRALYVSAQTREPYSEKVRNALINGARAKVTIKVVDEEGNHISNATTRAFFRMTYGENPGDTIEGVTDNNGFFTAEGKTTDIVFISAKADKHYIGLSKFHASKDKKLDGDKWGPWNVTNTVIIRSVKNPVPMRNLFYAKELPRTLQTTALGYDFMIGDWVKPYGKGEVTDVVATFDLLEKNETKNFVLHFVGEKNGYYKRKMFMNSYFRSEYVASTNDVYTTEMKGYGNLQMLDKDEYCVIRIRSKVDKDGNLISAYYGKIYPPFQYPCKRNDFSYRLYMNLKENERSLEFDGTGMAEDGIFYR